MSNRNGKCEHPGCLRRHRPGSESYRRTHGNSPRSISPVVAPETVDRGNHPSPFPNAMESKQGLVPCTIVVDLGSLWAVLEPRITKLLAQEKAKREIERAG